jgi:hypothetical protein
LVGKIPGHFFRSLLGEGVVLDPFMGGGSTIAAAAGYRSIGVESVATYF